MKSRANRLDATLPGHISSVKDAAGGGVCASARGDRVRKTAGTMTAALALVAILALPAFAQQPYPPTVAGVVEVSDQTIDCGAETFTISGSGWAANSQVSITFAGQDLGTAPTDATGSFSISVTPPEASGTQTLTVTQGSLSETAQVTCVTGVGPGGAEQGGGGVAFTGANITVGLLLLVGLILAGAATLALGRRRKNAAA